MLLRVLASVLVLCVCVRAQGPDAAQRCTSAYITALAGISKTDTQAVCTALRTYETCMAAATQGMDAASADLYMGQVRAAFATYDCSTYVPMNGNVPEIHAVNNTLNVFAENLVLRTPKEIHSFVDLAATVAGLVNNTLNKGDLRYLATNEAVALKADQADVSTRLVALSSQKDAALQSAMTSAAAALSTLSSMLAVTSTAVVSEQSRATAAETSNARDILSATSSISSLTSLLNQLSTSTSAAQSTIAGNLAIEISAARSSENSIRIDLSSRVSSLTLSSSVLSSDLSSTRTSVAKISDCSSRGLLFMNGDCIAPPPLTQASTLPCNSSYNGILRFNTNTGSFEVCDGRGNFRPVQGPVFENCLAIKTAYPNAPDGTYLIKPGTSDAFTTYCDMTTAGGGWTLVASIHEDCVECKCDAKDRWASTKGDWCNIHSSYTVAGSDVFNTYYRGGDGNWANTNTFGNVAGATSDDYKNPAYFDMNYDNVAIMHVPNNRLVKDWKSSTFLHYYTDDNFLRNEGGNLRNLYLKWPVRYDDSYSCALNAQSPHPAVKFAVGNTGVILNNMPPNSRGQTTQGYIHFRVINYEKASQALCPGVYYNNGCDTEHVCVGGGGYHPQGCPVQCSDFGAYDWDGAKHCRPLLSYSATNCDASAGWSNSGINTDSTLLILVR